MRYVDEGDGPTETHFCCTKWKFHPWCQRTNFTITLLFDSLSCEHVCQLKIKLNSPTGAKTLSCHPLSDKYGFASTAFAAWLFIHSSSTWLTAKWLYVGVYWRASVLSAAIRFHSLTRSHVTFQLTFRNIYSTVYGRVVGALSDSIFRL